MPTFVLDPARVEAIFLGCLFKDGEDTSNHVAPEGITQTVKFNPDRVESHKAEIEALLDELPDQFKTGSSFLSASEDKRGNQWTGFHHRVEQLFQLGMAIDKVEYQLPRDAWSILPGGMPFLVVK